MGKGGHGHGGWGHGPGFGHGGFHGGGWGHGPAPFWGPRPGAVVAAAAVGVGAGCIIASHRRPARYHRYGQRVIIVAPPAGVVLQPHERMVQIQRPYGVPAGTAVEVDIEGRQYYVTIPEGVPEGGAFSAQVPLQTGPVVAQAAPAQPQVAQAQYAPQPQQYAQPQQYEQQQQQQYAPPPQQAAPPSYESPLPPGWEEKKTPDGKPYYVDHNTKSTHWERPAPAPPSYGAPPAY